VSTSRWFAEFERDEARRQDRLDQIRARSAQRYCPNGNRWERCRALVDVNELGMRAIECDCPAGQPPKIRTMR
jgi:hypothetical protein